MNLFFPVSLEELRIRAIFFKCSKNGSGSFNIKFYFRVVWVFWLTSRSLIAGGSSGGAGSTFSVTVLYWSLEAQLPSKRRNIYML